MLGLRLPGFLSSIAKESLNLITVTVDQQHALKREILTRLQRAMGGAISVSSSPALPPSQQPISRPSPLVNRGIHISARTGQGRLMVPITLRNHLEVQEVITLKAAPLQDGEGLLIPAERFTLQPARLTLANRSEATVYVVVEVGPEFQPGRDYLSEIYIDGSNPQRLPFRLTVLPASTPSDTPGEFDIPR
jgi:hypothetical protein